MRRLALAFVALTACAEPPASPAVPLGLPALAVPADNPMSARKIALGRKLFFDRRLSPNGTMSCAMCHIPEQGFTAHALATSVGIEGRSVRRNAPTVLNVAFQQRLFHDGRETTLENQVWGPLLASNEMGNPSIGYVIETIRAHGDYRGLFEAAFDGKGVSAERIGQALAAYERTLLAADSRFDRWRYGGESGALGDAGKRGFAVFTGKARCVTCHTLGEKSALFTDHGFHNTGVGWRRAHDAPQRTRVQIAPGVHAELERRTVESFSEAPARDVGRYEITLDPRDRWAYKTPSLRNVPDRALHARRVAGEPRGGDRVLRPWRHRQPGQERAAGAARTLGRGTRGPGGVPAVAHRRRHRSAGRRGTQRAARAIR
jgi:cytochrome c peroxidase